MTPLFYQIHSHDAASHQIYRRILSGGGNLNYHPNVLSVIHVSETLFPLCIVSPWMPDGNIVQYTEMNPDTDRMMLVRVRPPEDRR